jgi:UDP-N-acetylmuramoyl-tripeptide--D-alanyl-D-alanine ligase
MFKKIITFKLKIATKILLWRKKPQIIAITGSAGKTTTKEIIRELLSSEFDVLASTEGYNTEIGAPLVLFGEKVPEKMNSILAWTAIIWRCYLRAFFQKNLAEKVIIEMGADHPGDISYLSRLFRPDKAIVLTVLPVHLESFLNIEAVAAEKATLLQNIKKGGRAYLNADDPKVIEMRTPEKVKKMTFGTTPGADLVAKNIKSELTGMSFELWEGEQKQDLSVRLYGEQLIYPLLAAIAVARSEHISYAKIKSTLKNVTPTKGRMNVIEGTRGSIIIDDSYNANPESVLRALDFLGRQEGRKIALLGNMNELGNYEREGHERVGEAVAKNVDLLITVGQIASKYISGAANAAAMSKEAIKNFQSAKEAGEFLSGELRRGDIILVKGSQNKVRLENAIVKFMAHPEESDKVLVRQSEFWKNQA